MILGCVAEPNPPERAEPVQGLGLVVERRTGESVVIGDDVEVRLLRVKGDYAQIGVVAPREVRVERGEKYQRPHP